MITFYEYWYWNWADRLFFSSWKLWIMNMQPTVFWDMKRCGLILRFAQQFRPNHWHPTTHLLNYTASFPRRSKSYLYQHSINISSRNIVGYLNRILLYPNTESRSNVYTCNLNSTYNCNFRYLPKTGRSLSMAAPRDMRTAADSINRQWQLNLHVLIFPLTPEIVVSNFNILIQCTFCILYLGDSLVSEFYLPTFRNTVCSIFIDGVRRKNVLPAYIT
jgi:hypothetical protein